jgi:nicotinamidase-related amidase
MIISGGSTDVGVAATVFAGRDMDCNMIVVRDACATNHDQRAHDILMDAVFPRISLGNPPSSWSMFPGRRA